MEQVSERGWAVLLVGLQDSVGKSSETPDLASELTPALSRSVARGPFQPRLFHGALFSLNKDRCQTCFL